MTLREGEQSGAGKPAQAEGAGAKARCGEQGAPGRAREEACRPLEWGAWGRLEGRLGPAGGWNAELRNVGFIPQVKVVLEDLVLRGMT